MCVCVCVLEHDSWRSRIVRVGQRANAPHEVIDCAKRSLEYTYGSVRGFEALHLLLGLGELLLRCERLQDFEDMVPECVVVLVQQDDETGRLRVEARRDVEDGLFYDV